MMQSVSHASYTVFMATKKSSKPKLPLTLADVGDELDETYKELNSFVTALCNDISQSLEKNFHDKGGCEKCRGRGWIVTWDTMDYMDGSAAEYSTCPDPECTEASRAGSGLHPVRSKYDYNRDVEDVVVSSDAYRAVVSPVISQMKDIRRAQNELAYKRRDFKKGDLVVVARGRKVPIGTVGRVAWISYNTGGILVKEEDKWQDRAADGTWVDPRNLEIVLAE